MASRSIRLIASGLCILSWAVWDGYGQSPAKASAAMDGAARKALMAQYCASCHNEKLKTAGWWVEQVDPSHVEANPERWERIVHKLRAGMMPPPGKPRPEFATYETFLSSLEADLDRTTAVKLPQPGLHRLNRAEYSNAVRDLLAINVDAAKFLPSDDSTRGFDNQAGTLTISPALIDGYRSAAGNIARIALGDAVLRQQTDYRVPEDTSQDYHIEGLPFGTRGGLVVNHTFPADGEYALKVWPVNLGNMDNNQAFGTVSGEKLEFLMDGEQLHVYDWDRELRAGAAIHGGTPDFRFKATSGEHSLGVTFLAQNYSPNIADFNKHFLRSTIETGGIAGYTFYPHVGYIRIDGPFDAKPAGASASRNKVLICKPSAEKEEAACAKRIIENLARNAYRRPATDRDVERLMGFYQQARNSGGNFEKGVELAIQSVLMDPSFLFRKEEEPTSVAAGAKYRVSDTELASRLSFFLWSSIPDNELLTLASQNKLRDPKTLDAQVKRMLADPKSQAFVKNFFGQWLQIRGLHGMSPEPKLFPDFDDNLRNAFETEAEMFTSAIVHEDRSLTDLLNADYTFLNERLAKHYGISGIYGSNFRRITLDADHDVRRGLLGKGFFLEVSSNPARTSPVARGKIVMNVFLGLTPPDPPPGVVIKISSTDADVHGAKKPSMREQMVAHRKIDPCLTCHRIMDPIGFTLENFDAIGAWRTLDAGSPIDSSGGLVDGREFSGVKGLREALARYMPQTARVATRHLFTYALGRGVEYYDMPAVRSIIRDAEKNNYRFSSLVLGVVKSEQFQSNMKGLAYGAVTGAE